MECPYLEAEPVARCLAYSDGIRILRNGELREFCRGERHPECKIYRQKVNKLNKSGLGNDGETRFVA